MILAATLFLLGAIASGITAFTGIALSVAGLCKALSMGCMLFSSMTAATGLLRGKF